MAALDRLAPARRDACRGPVVSHQSWRDLLFVHWEVPVEAVRRLVPPGLAIDVFDGRAYVGLVPFTMRDVRVGPVPVADFLETNLRTYVHKDGVPGVWFFSLDAASALTVWGGRGLYRLPYHRAEMSCTVAGASVEYRSRRRGGPAASLDIRWTTLDAQSHLAVPGTLEHFLTERFALYSPSPRGGGALRRLRVHHPSWPLRRARIDRLTDSIARAAGLDVGRPLDVVLASPEGVAVETFAAER
jgi:uncharacterized protein YqjF (DUF2071 family)